MKEIQLTQGQVARVDDENYERFSSVLWIALWNPKTQSYYAQRADGNGGIILMHHEVLGVPKGQRVDHKDHDTLNNCRDNLRAADSSGNMHNKRKLKVNGSRFKGVSWDKSAKKWKTRIRDGAIGAVGAGGRAERIVGYYVSDEDAARAYDNAARVAFGSFACLNFPEPGERSALGGPERIERPKIGRLEASRSSRKRCDGTSKYKGVSRCRNSEKWIAGIKDPSVQKRKHLGTFSNEEDAARAYDAAAREFFGCHAALNFPVHGERSALRSAA